MLGNKKDKNTAFLGNKLGQSSNSLGHKKYPIQSSSGNALTNTTNIIEQHKQLDEQEPIGLKIRKNSSKKSGIEKN